MERYDDAIYKYNLFMSKFPNINIEVWDVDKLRKLNIL